MAVANMMEAINMAAIPTPLLSAPPHTNENIANKINTAMIINQIAYSEINFISIFSIPVVFAPDNTRSLSKFYAKNQ